MAAEDIDRLCCIFYRVQIEELHCVDDQKFPWLAPIRGLSLSPAVDSIRCSLKALQGEQERLQCTATLYAWLVPRGAYTQWALYRYSKDRTVRDASEIGEHLVETFRSSGSSAAHGAVDQKSAYSLTILMRQFPSTYEPVCFHIWRELPFVAIHTPGMSDALATRWLPLASALGDLNERYHGIYIDLRLAYSMANFLLRFPSPRKSSL